jgi:ribosomal protein S9
MGTMFLPPNVRASHVFEGVTQDLKNLAQSVALDANVCTAGCVTRDPRKVERKKAGRVKARKMPTWVKR